MRCTVRNSMMRLWLALLLLLPSVGWTHNNEAVRSGAQFVYDPWAEDAGLEEQPEETVRVNPTQPAETVRVQPRQPLPVPRHVNDSTGTFQMGGKLCVATVWGYHSIITASHCLAPGQRITAQFRDKNGNWITVRNCRQVLRKNKALDYAIVDCPDIGSRVPIVKIAGRRPSPGEALTLVTHDFHRRARQRIEDGVYSQSYYFPDRVDGDRRMVENFVLTRVNSYPGNSGSLVYDKNRNAVGLLWGGPTSSGSVAFLTPMSKIVADLKAHAPGLAAAELSSSSRTPASLNPDSERRPMYAWNPLKQQWQFIMWAVELGPVFDQN